eukprot:1858636-Heterocapsa_arctica.AAC.1
MCRRPGDAIVWHSERDPGKMDNRSIRPYIPHDSELSVPDEPELSASRLMAVRSVTRRRSQINR